MIASLYGTAKIVSPNQVIISCNGVGYEVFVPTQTMVDIQGEEATKISLSTHMVVKEDSHTLFGFSTIRERDLFRLLITVNGIGAKIAITMLSFYSGGELAEVIAQGDSSALTKIPGIGKKGAEKTVSELDKKIQPFVFVDPIEQEKRSKAEIAQKDSCDALVALGFKEKEASKAVEEVFAEGMNSSELTRAALQSIKG